MSKATLLKQLQSGDQAEARAAALEYLGLTESAVTWKDDSGMTHIFDYERNTFVRSFKTRSGQEYIIRTPKDGITLRRATILRQMMTPIAMNEPLSDVVARVRRIRALYNGLFSGKGDPAELGAEITAIEKTMTESVTKAWDAAAIACTIFIVRPDENLETWSEGEAEKKIADWNESLIHEADFFFSVIAWSALWNETLTAFFLRLGGEAK